MLRANDRFFIVPMPDADIGNIGAPRPVIGLGAGLTGHHQSIGELISGSPAELERGVAGPWQYRPAAPTRYGPVVVIGNEYQLAPTDIESALARNAVDRFILLHERARKTESLSLVLEQGVKPLDQTSHYVLASQGTTRCQ